MKLLLGGALFLILTFGTTASSQDSISVCGQNSDVAQGVKKIRPNVLFIAIDDQNDWIGHMGGHPLAKTPHMDAVASRGTSFLNAHCQSPLCNPSRSSVLFGLRPTTTGIYGLSPSIRSIPKWRDRVSLAQHLKANDYKTSITGKIFHQGFSTKAQRDSEFDVWGPAGGVGIKPAAKLIPPTSMGNHPAMDWGTFPHSDTEKGDFQITTWAIDEITKANPDDAFFLAVGYSLPHVPCYATQQWFDLYPDDDSVLPPINRDDRNDTPRFSWYLHWDLPEPRLAWVQHNTQWRNLVRSYLACTSFVDAQIGRLIEGLKTSGRFDNTVIVIWGDHGWHLGEKLITGKNTLWEESTRVPLIFSGPGITASQQCNQPVELLDIYPTLIDLCNLDARDDLEGISLLPQLRDAAAVRERPAITSHNQGNHSVRTTRYRYILYADGSEELYDHLVDPHEWNNIAAEQSSADLITSHQRWLPQIDLPPATGSAHRILVYDRVRDEAIWEDRITILRTDPIP